ncbi:hypothetical protein OPQ81_003055 [Rhizoctonia solani]|nr:hypothetical protein OPQ81_003055 [Rhizoctonia solani]
MALLSPLQSLPYKPRPSIYRCSPLAFRHTLSSHEFARSMAKRNNALERVAVHKFKSHLPTPSPHSSLPKLKSTAVTPVFTRSVSSQNNLAPPTPPSTPPTPLEVDQSSLVGTKPKASIFENTAKSDELLDLTLAALYRIYIEDFSQESSSSQSKSTVQPGTDAVSSEPGAYRDGCDRSPDLTDEAGVSSGSSTPESFPTPPPMSPEVCPDIACPSREGTPQYRTASCPTVPVKAKLLPVGRTQSLPINFQSRAQPVAPGPVLEDKSLRWFITELLRRSRASASVVQLALHYLKQAREPVGEILNHKFKPARVGGEDGYSIDSPLVDPRKLVLAALMLSSKILHDHAPNSRAWSRVCGLEPRQSSSSSPLANHGSMRLVVCVACICLCMLLDAACTSNLCEPNMLILFSMKVN